MTTTTDQVKVEFAGGHFFLPEGMKRLHVYKEQIQEYLDSKYNSKKAVERVGLIQKFVRAAGKIYEKVFPRLKNDVLNIVAYLTSKTGVCNVTVDFMRNTVQKRKARLEKVEQKSVKLPSPTGIKEAYAAIREHTGQFVFARLSNKGAQSNVIFDTTHPNFPEMMKAIWDIDVVFDESFSFFENDRPVPVPEDVPDTVPQNVPDQNAETPDTTAVEDDSSTPNVSNAFDVENASKKKTLTNENTVSKNECQEQNKKYDNQKLAEQIQSFLYNAGKPQSALDELYKISMQFKSKCVAANIPTDTIEFELREGLKGLINSTINPCGYFYNTMQNKFNQLTTPKVVEVSEAPTTDSQNTANISQEEPSIIEQATVDVPDWMINKQHQQHVSEEESNAKATDFEKLRDQIKREAKLAMQGA